MRVGNTVQATLWGYHLWAGPVRGWGASHQGQNGARSVPSDWKRPPSEKPGLGRRCRQDMPAWPRHCPEPPASFRPNQQPSSQHRGLTGTGRAGWPSPEGLQCHGCPPQGGGCSHRERPSCRAWGDRTRLQLPALWERKLGCAGHAASLLPPALSTSLPLPAGSTSLTGVHCIPAVCRAEGAGATGSQRPDSCSLWPPPMAMPAPWTRAQPLTWNVPW